MNWICLPFQSLSLEQLYEIMQLRQLVFIVEQNCPYLDADDKDIKGHHLMGLDENGRLAAYARLLPAGVSYPTEISIGRVVTHPAARRTGAGRALMTEAIQRIKTLYGPAQIRIGAQLYLLKFYESLGFVVASDEYLEDGIPHIEMSYEL